MPFPSCQYFPRITTRLECPFSTCALLSRFSAASPLLLLFTYLFESFFAGTSDWSLSETNSPCRIPDVLPSAKSGLRCWSLLPSLAAPASFFPNSILQQPPPFGGSSLCRSQPHSPISCRRLTLISLEFQGCLLGSKDPGPHPFNDLTP